MQGSDGAAPDERERRGDAMMVLGRLQMARDSPVSLIAAHMSLSCAGRLRSASSDGVVVEIAHPPETTLRGSIVAVSFAAADSMTGFVSQVTDVADASDGALLVTLAVPGRLQAGDRRSTVRVPVPPNTVSATIVQGTARGAARAIDLSLLGILIELDEERAATLRVGDRVVLRLTLGQIQLLVDAEVRRRDGRRFGLLFQTNGEPPERMTKIMWKLQKLRMPSR